MNTATNAFLLAAATTLVSLGAANIASSLVPGAVELVLGFLAFVLYEKFPVSK